MGYGSNRRHFFRAAMGFAAGGSAFAGSRHAVPRCRCVPRLRARAPQQPPRARDPLDPRQCVRALGDRAARARLLTRRAAQRHHDPAVRRRPRVPAQPVDVSARCPSAP